MSDTPRLDLSGLPELFALIGGTLSAPPVEARGVEPRTETEPPALDALRLGWRWTF
jgi:hypothetical protein